ncbi:hypothetical protein AB4Z54_39720, partial [Streptomyces sp. MCAF7]
LREGSLFEPVADETYDLIVSNPPFVISPPSSGRDRLVYRDGGMSGDDLCRTLVQQSADHLTDGGWCQLLANWQHVEGEDWRERIASWVPSGCDAWIVQREVQDITQYAELWLRDAGAHLAGPAEYAARYDAWLEEFEARRTRAVGFGWITLRKSGADRPAVTAEEWPHPVEQPSAFWSSRGSCIRWTSQWTDGGAGGSAPERVRRSGSRPDGKKLPLGGVIMAGSAGRPGRALFTRGSRVRLPWVPRSAHGEGTRDLRRYGICRVRRRAAAVDSGAHAAACAGRARCEPCRFRGPLRSLRHRRAERRDLVPGLRLTGPLWGAECRSGRQTGRLSGYRSSGVAGFFRLTRGREVPSHSAASP